MLVFCGGGGPQSNTIPGGGGPGVRRRSGTCPTSSAGLAGQRSQAALGFLKAVKTGAGLCDQDYTNHNQAGVYEENESLRVQAMVDGAAKKDGDQDRG